MKKNNQSHKLLESYEDEENNAQQYKDFIDTLDDAGLYDLDNAMDALEINTERIYISREVKTELMDQVKGIIQTNQIYNSQNLKS